MNRLLFILIFSAISLVYKDLKAIDQGQYSQRMDQTKSVLISQVKCIFREDDACEKIIYSIFNLDYHIVIVNNDDFYRLYFFRYKLTDSLPILLFYNTEKKENKEYISLFDGSLYWMGNLNSSSFPGGTVNFMDANKSDFVYLDKNGKVVAEFHLPTFSDYNPLKKNHLYLYDLRRSLTVNFILR